MTSARSFGYAFLLPALAGGLVPLSTSAQETETGGIQLTFTGSLRAEATDNETLTADPARSSLNSVASLSFGLLSATRVSSFALGSSADLRYVGADDDLELSTPRLTGAYTRTSADATFEMNASLDRVDLDRIDLVLLDDPLGGDLFVDATDLIGVVEGTSERRSAVIDARLTWGLTSRASYSLEARVEDVSYSGGVANALEGTVLNDSRRVTLGAGTQLDLTTAARLSAGVDVSRFEDLADDTTSDEIGMDLGVAIDRPLGAVSAGVEIADTDAGQRYGISVGRSLDLPLGPVSGSIGVVQAAAGDLAITAQAGLRRDLPAGTLGFDLARSVSSLNTLNTEQLTTRAAATYARELTPLTGLQLGFSFAQVEDMASGDRGYDAALETTLSRALTEDWSADAGYVFRASDNDPGDRATSNTVFVELRRSFVTRY